MPHLGAEESALESGYDSDDEKYSLKDMCGDSDNTESSGNENQSTMVVSTVVDALASVGYYTYIAFNKLFGTAQAEENEGDSYNNAFAALIKRLKNKHASPLLISWNPPAPPIAPVMSWKPPTPPTAPTAPTAPWLAYDILSPSPPFNYAIDSNPIAVIDPLDEFLEQLWTSAENDMLQQETLPKPYCNTERGSDCHYCRTFTLHPQGDEQIQASDPDSRDAMMEEISAVAGRTFAADGLYLDYLDEVEDEESSMMDASEDNSETLGLSIHKKKKQKTSCSL